MSRVRVYRIDKRRVNIIRTRRGKRHYVYIYYKDKAIAKVVYDDT